MADDPTKGAIVMQPLCKLHQRLLVQQTGYGPDDAWLALTIVTQIALFQAATAHPSTYEKIGHDVRRMSELGCLACERPDAFGEIVEVAKDHDLSTIKALGERWVKEGAKS